MLPSQTFRAFTAFCAVGLYMVVGWLFRLDPNSYLLAGILFVLMFQLAVARRPLVELWLKQPPARFVTWQGLAATAVFLIYPVYALVTDWRAASGPVRLWEIAAVAGTLPLGATLVRATMRTWTSLLICLVAGGAPAAGLMVLVSLVKHHGWHPHPHAWQIGASYLLLYLPVCFVMEEVFFRGGLDSYVQRPDDRHG